MRGVGEAVDDLNDNRVSVEDFPGERLIKYFAERVNTQNAENERRFAIGEGGGGPVDESAKVIKKRRFDLIFRQLRHLRTPQVGGPQQPQAKG